MSAAEQLWTASIVDRPEGWTFDLSRADQDAALRALGEDASLASACTRAISLRHVAADRSIYERIAAAIVEGPGFARLRRIPVEALSHRTAKMLHILCAKSFGGLQHQDKRGSLALDVMDPGDAIEPAEQGNPGRRWNDLPCHTDGAFGSAPPRLISLLNFGTASHGGAVRLVSAATILARFDRDPALRAALTRPVPFDRAHQLEVDDAVLQHVPIASGAGAGLRFRFLHYQIDLAPVPELTRRAVERVATLAQDPRLVAEIRMAPGEILLINNMRVLHGREAFTNKPRPLGPRHQMRLWLN